MEIHANAKHIKKHTRRRGSDESRIVDMVDTLVSGLTDFKSLVNP